MGIRRRQKRREGVVRKIKNKLEGHIDNVKIVRVILRDDVYVYAYITWPLLDPQSTYLCL